MSVNSSEIKFIIDRIEGNKAVLISEAEEELVIEKKWLPKGIKDGNALIVQVSEEKAYTEEKQKKAKDLLNEILKN